MTTQHTLVCPSCGVPWTDHLGMTGTCAKLQREVDALRIISVWAEIAQRDGNPFIAKMVQEKCDKVLEEVE